MRPKYLILFFTWLHQVERETLLNFTVIERIFVLFKYAVFENGLRKYILFWTEFDSIFVKRSIQNRKSANIPDHKKAKPFLQWDEYI